MDLRLREDLMLTLRHKLEIGGALFALVLIGVAGGSWLGAREEGIRLKATLDAQNSVIAEAGKRESDREAVLKVSLSQIEDLKKATQTPQEALKQLPAVLPLPQPITFNLPPNPAQGSPTQGQAPATASIPAADLKPLYDFAANCKECQARLAEVQADQADDAVKIGALTKERNAAVTAAKGGSKWTRIKRAAKWVVIGVAVGAAGVAVAKR